MACHAGDSFWKRRDGLFAAVILTNQSSSEGFKGPNSGMMGKVEYARPLLNYLYPLTDMQTNARISAVAEFTQEGAGRKTTLQQQPSPLVSVFSRAPPPPTHSPLFWSITIKWLCRLFFFFFFNHFQVPCSNSGHSGFM